MLSFAINIRSTNNTGTRQSEGVVARADYGFPVCEWWVGWTSQTISFFFFSSFFLLSFFLLSGQVMVLVSLCFCSWDVSDGGPRAGLGWARWWAWWARRWAWWAQLASPMKASTFTSLSNESFDTNQPPQMKVLTLTSHQSQSFDTNQPSKSKFRH